MVTSCVPGGLGAGERMDTDTLDGSLAAQLARLSLSVFAVPGDGNCLFRALAHQLGKPEHGHSALRSAVVDHMRRHPHWYAPFVDHASEAFEQRLRRMAKPGVYGDNIEIVAFARCFNTPVVIHQEGMAPWIVDPNQNEDNTPNRTDRNLIHIVYHSWEHYSSTTGVFSSYPSDSTSLVTKGKSRKVSSADILTAPERLVMKSIPAHLDADLNTVRRLLKEFAGDIGKVVEAFVALTCVEEADEDSVPEVLSLPVVESNAMTAQIDISDLATAPGSTSDASAPHESIPTSCHGVAVPPPTPVSASTAKRKGPSAKEKREDKKRMQKERALARKRTVASSAYVSFADKGGSSSVGDTTHAAAAVSLEVLSAGIKATFI